MPAPTVDEVRAYLGTENYNEAEVADAYAAEKANQARRCRVPADDAEWPDDLVQALKRRCASNLALRGVPLSVEVNVAEAAVSSTRVGGLDAEVRRFEAPYRRTVIG